jgi:hypothetical protein
MVPVDTALGLRDQEETAIPIDEDRRDDSRVKVLKQVRISDLAGTQFPELATVVDLTREGLYFTTRSSQFTIGTELQLAFPDTGSECSCVTVRVEQLPDGRQGVGVRILGW